MANSGYRDLFSCGRSWVCAPVGLYTKDHHKNCTTCLPVRHAGIRVGV